MPLTRAIALIEAPGVVCALGERAMEGSTDDLSVGANVEDALGVSWATLNELSAIDAPVATRRGQLRVERLLGEGGTTRLLLIAEPRLMHSTTPPPSSSRGGSLTLVRGQDPSARAAVDLALRLVKTSLPIYLGGEEGSGVDQLSNQLLDELAKKTPRLELHLGTLTRAAMEASLFGVGDAQVALLCLHDLHELDLETGRRLAHELETGRLREAQLLADGRRDLRSRVLQGTFSKELATMVRSTSVELPALREREDIGFLIAAILKRIAEQNGVRGAKGRDNVIELDPEAMRALKSYAWPHNLRELSMWLERAVAAAAPSLVLRREHFPEFSENVSETGSTARVGLRRTAERAALEEALRISAGNVSAAAKRLGVARSTLYRLLERHGLPH